MHSPLSPRRTSSAGGALALVASLGCSLGCSLGSHEGAASYEIDDVRVVRRAERSQAGPVGGVRGGAPASASAPDFGWTLPAGWEALQTSSMRRLNARVAGHPDAECYLTVLPGTAGGVTANVDRWRGQMGLPTLAPEELDTLPRRTLLGQDAILVHVEGEFRGMGGTARPDWGLAGLIAEIGSTTVFLKLVGPAQIVADELEHFEALAASVTFDVSTPTPSGADPHVHGDEPHAHGAGADSAGTLGDHGGGLRWTGQAGWRRGQERSMRLVSFEIGRSTECYVTVLAGGAGGRAANINRWRKQMGLELATRDELAALPTIDVLGIESHLVELSGNFTGMSGGGVADALLLGVICETGAQTLFVKMTGPTAEVAPQRDAFLAFCRSLQEDER